MAQQTQTVPMVSSPAVGVRRGRGVATRSAQVLAALVGGGGMFLLTEVSPLAGAVVGGGAAAAVLVSGVRSM